jgi:protein-tyrosine-phosphatase
MNIINQNDVFIARRINKQLIKNPKAGEKKLPISILLENIEEKHKNQKQDFKSPKEKRFDVFDYIIAADKRRNGESVEIDEDGKLIIHGGTNSKETDEPLQADNDTNAVNEKLLSHGCGEWD